jgi:hypothetical protein
MWMDVVVSVWPIVMVDYGITEPCSAEKQRFLDGLERGSMGESPTSMPGVTLA